MTFSSTNSFYIGRVLLVFLLALSCSQGAQKTTTPLTVCEVLQDLGKYRGRIIEVRGEFNGGHLRGNCLPLTTGGHTWFNGIEIDFPKNPSVEGEEPTQWTFDVKVISEAAERAAALQRASGPEATVMATVAGRLDVPDPLMVQTEKGLAPNGYGHLNVYPARLIIVRIKDIAVESPVRR